MSPYLQRAQTDLGLDRPGRGGYDVWCEGDRVDGSLPAATRSEDIVLRYRTVWTPDSSPKPKEQ